jgi:hypothetical protein
MGFANVWGSHPKDNAKGGRAWYVGDVLFPNEMMRDFFLLVLCLFFLPKCGCRDPMTSEGGDETMNQKRGEFVRTDFSAK